MAVLLVPLIETGLVERVGADAFMVGDAVGVGDTVGDAVAVGDAVGDAVAVGEAVGDAVGEAVGDAVGETVGDAVGETVGDAVGETVGDAVGETVGDAVGETVGDTVGETVGDTVGETVGDAVGETVGDAVGEAVGDAVGEAVGDAVGVGVGVGVTTGEDVDVDVVLEPPWLARAAIKPTPTMPPTTNAVLLDAAGKTEPSAITSCEIAHVKLSVFGGSVSLSYGGEMSSFPTGAFVLSKNENVTVDVFTDVFGSKAISGLNVPSMTSASQETIRPGADGCDATTPFNFVGVCAPAVRNVAEPTMPITAATATERRIRTSIERFKRFLS